jgi:cell division protein FtsB
VVDESGVALASIQGLNRKLEVTEAEAKAKEAEIQDLKQSVAELKALVEKLTVK